MIRKFECETDLYLENNGAENSAFIVYCNIFGRYKPSGFLRLQICHSEHRL